MEIKKNLDGEKLTAELIGRLDAVTAIEFDKDMAASLVDVKDLTLNFDKLEYIASAGLRILLKSQKKMAVKGSMKIINIKPEVREVLDMTGFAKLLTLEEKKPDKKISINF